MSENLAQLAAKVEEWKSRVELKPASSEQAPAEDREASQLVGSGSLVGGRRPNRRGVSPLFGAMLAAAVIVGGMGAMMHGYQPQKPREKSPEDLARIAAAKAKQDRKRALKEAQKTKAPNIVHEPHREDGRE